MWSDRNVITVLWYIISLFSHKTRCEGVNAVVEQDSVALYNNSCHCSISTEWSICYSLFLKTKEECVLVFVSGEGVLRAQRGLVFNDNKTHSLVIINNIPARTTNTYTPWSSLKFVTTFLSRRLFICKAHYIPSKCHSSQ